MTRNFPSMLPEMNPDYGEFREHQFGEFGSNPMERKLCPGYSYRGYPQFGYPNRFPKGRILK